jgi:O-antigen/teichoic acid export membrane protein
MQLPNLLLSVFFSPTIVGYYGLASRLLRMPITLLGNAISQVFYQRASIAYLNGELSKAVDLIFHSLFTLSVFPLILLTLFGGDYFATIFGDTWMEAGTYVQILSPLTLLIFVGIPLVSLPNIMERQEVGLIFSVALFIMQVISLILGGMIGNIYLTLLCLSITGSCVWLLFFAWIFRNTGLSGKLVMISLKPTVLLCCLLGATLFIGVALSGLSQWLLLFFSGLVCLVYFLLLFGLDPQLKQYSQPYLYKAIKHGR